MKTNPSIFKVFQHGDDYFEMINDPEFSRKNLLQQILVIFIFSLLYGIMMGSYNGFLQSMVTGIKVPCLIFLIWIIIFAFVSSQLAWNLRPFVGSKDLPFEWFRERESNFYVAVIQSAINLFDPEPVQKKDNVPNQTDGQQR